MKAIMRTTETDLDGQGVKTYKAYDLPVIDNDDYWTNVTGIPCPVAECDGTILWYEAAYVPGYRICTHCQRHFLAKGNTEHPYLIDCGRKGCRAEDRVVFAAMQKVPSPFTILDARVPLPGRTTSSPRPVPGSVVERVRGLMEERNTCTDERVEEIDSTILYLLSPYTDRVHTS